MQRLIQHTLLPLLLLTGAPSAIAAPITVDFAGTMNVSTDAFNVLGGLGSPITFSGSYTYETATRDGNGTPTTDSSSAPHRAAGSRSASRASRWRRIR